MPPGESFDYTIPLSIDNQWGTYWVHSHAGVSTIERLLAAMHANASRRANTWTVSARR